LGYETKEKYTSYTICQFSISTEKCKTADMTISGRTNKMSYRDQIIVDIFGRNTQ